MSCKIYETLNPINEMKVDKTNGLMTLSGTFGVCGVLNNNKRIYEKGNYGKMVKEMQERIKNEGGIPGELEHPNSMNITLENISHKITKIDINEDGVVSGEIQLLNTPKGLIAQSIVEGGLPLYVSSRAMGNVGKNGVVTLESLATYDLVGTPGFSQAKMSLNESVVLNEGGMCIISENNEEKYMTEFSKEQIELIESIIAKREKALVEQIDEWMSEYYNDKVRLLAETAIHQYEYDNKERREESVKSLVESANNEFASRIDEWMEHHYNDKVRLLAETAIHQYEYDNKERREENIKAIAESANHELAEQIDEWVEQHLMEKVDEQVRDFVIENYTPRLETWLNEHFVESIKPTDSLSDIKDMLTMLEGMEPTKAAYPGRVITESNEPSFIQQMPMKYRPLYEAATPAAKDMIARRARIYNFSDEASVERFWESVDFGYEQAPQAQVVTEMDAFRAKLRARRGL